MQESGTFTTHGHRRANVPDEIRGYGHVKEKSITVAKALWERRLQAFRMSPPDGAKLAA